jgi:hypothetical protein
MKLVDINFEEACVSFECEACGGTGEQLAPGRDTDPDYCGQCGALGIHVEYLGTLFANLAVAGALCAAFELGQQWEFAFRVYPGGARIRREYADRKHWRPNLDARAVPGWGR